MKKWFYRILPVIFFLIIFSGCDVFREALNIYDGHIYNDSNSGRRHISKKRNSQGKKTISLSRKSYKRKKRSQKSFSPMEDQGILNDVHRKYAGKIVWANKTINMENPVESSFRNEFTSSDYICGRFYLSQSIQNYFLQDTGKKEYDINYYYDVYINGKKVKWKMDTGRLYGKYIKRTTQQVFFYMPPDSKYLDANVGWSKLANKLSPGDYEIRVDLRVKRNSKVLDRVLATGTFIYHKRSGDVVKIGRSLSTLKAGMRNRALEAEILECIQGYSTARNWKEKYEKVKIKSRDWHTVRYRNGIIKGRSISAYCYAVDPKGHGRIQTFVFFQQYNGSGFSKVLRFYGIVSGSLIYVDKE